MGNYRVWEANRKCFLYPENWIESERDDRVELEQLSIVCQKWVTSLYRWGVAIVRRPFRQQTPTEVLGLEVCCPNGIDVATEGPIHCVSERSHATIQFAVQLGHLKDPY